MSSADFTEMLPQLVDPALVTDDLGVIARANAAAGTLFGCSAPDLAGTQLDELLPRQQDDRHDTVFTDCPGSPPGAPVAGIREPVRARHDGGTGFDVRVATSELARGTFLVVVTPRVAAADPTGTYLDTLRQLTESAVDATVVIDSAGIVRCYNAAAESTFGFPSDVVLGKNVATLMPEEYAAEHDANIARFEQEARRDASRAVGMRRPVVARTSTGTLQPIRIALSKVNLPGGNFYVGSITKVDGDAGSAAEVVNDLIERRTRALREQRDEFERLSSMDALTQLANRREFDRSLEREIRRGKRTGSATSLLMLDLDHFKLYNDYYGHQAGDECLQSISHILGNVFRRGTDLVARYGGEEFAVVMGGTNYPTAMMLAERLIAAVSDAALPHATSPTASKVTISVGVTAAARESNVDATQLIEWADGALYESKHSGRNCATGVDHGGATSLDGISLGPVADEHSG